MNKDFKNDNVLKIQYDPIRHSAIKIKIKKEKADAFRLLCDGPSPQRVPKGAAALYALVPIRRGER